MQHVVIIGSGATALAVLEVAAAQPGTRVTLIRPADRLEARLRTGSDPQWNHEAFAAIIRGLRREVGLKLPPPKTHFGEMPETALVTGWGPIWRSTLHGGLTQFWGASMVPFTDHELCKWPLNRSDLEADYRAISLRVGITGADDALRRYFKDGFSNLPPIEPIAPIRLLLERLPHRQTPSLDVVSGFSRVAVETRQNHPHTCRYLGDCMSGCTQTAVFSALPHIEAYLAKASVVQGLVGRAYRIEFERKKVIVRSANGDEACCAYDHVFICAGALQSVELLIRSLNIEDEATISDNMILSFPVFFTGRLPNVTRKDYFALTNGMLVVRPHDTGQAALFVQLYPNPDYFWQYFAPVWLWPYVGPVMRRARDRFFWARAYLPSRDSQHYRVGLANDGPVLSLERKADLSSFKKRVWSELRQLFSNAGFWVPSTPLLAAKTSSHYAGGFPMGGQCVNSLGAIGNDAYICDSTNFPDAPAASPTFTAMANARRIARLALTDGVAAKV